MLQREDTSTRLSVLGCARGTSVYICSKYRRKQSRRVVKQSSRKLQRLQKYRFHLFWPPPPSLFQTCFSASSNKSIKEGVGESARVSNERGKVGTCLQWPCNLGGKHIHPETWLLSSERLNLFWKKPDVTFHVLIRLFIMSPVFPWVHNSTTMQSRWIACARVSRCVCCIPKKQLCTRVLF